MVVLSNQWQLTALADSKGAVSHNVLYQQLSIARYQVSFYAFKHNCSMVNPVEIIKMAWMKRDRATRLPQWSRGS